MNHENQPEEFVRKIMEKEAIWWRHQALWRKIHYSIGILSVVIAAVTASMASLIENMPWLPAVLGALGAICAGMLTLLNPNQKANDRLRAYKIINTALINYQARQIEAPALINALATAGSVAHGQGN